MREWRIKGVERRGEERRRARSKGVDAKVEHRGERAGERMLLIFKSLFRYVPSIETLTVRWHRRPGVSGLMF